MEQDEAALPKTMSSREFNQDTSSAKRAAKSGPVIITDRGKPAHVLLTYEAYLEITEPDKKISDLLALPGAEDVELTLPIFGELGRDATLD